MNYRTLFDPAEVPKELRDCFEEIEVPCGAPWRRQTKTVRTRDGEPLTGGWPVNEGGQRIGASGVGHWRDRSDTETLGWEPTCRCDAGEPVPSTVLDPFGGSGTTALVADRLGRDAVLIELNPDYARMAVTRLERDGGIFMHVRLERADKEAAE